MQKLNSALGPWHQEEVRSSTAGDSGPEGAAVVVVAPGTKRKFVPPLPAMVVRRPLLSLLWFLAISARSSLSKA